MTCKKHLGCLVNHPDGEVCGWLKEPCTCTSAPQHGGLSGTDITGEKTEATIPLQDVFALIDEAEDQVGFEYRICGEETKKQQNGVHQACLHIKRLLISRYGK